MRTTPEHGLLATPRREPLRRGRGLGDHRVGRHPLSGSRWAEDFTPAGFSSPVRYAYSCASSRSSATTTAADPGVPAEPRPVLQRHHVERLVHPPPRRDEDGHHRGLVDEEDPQVDRELEGVDLDRLEGQRRRPTQTGALPTRERNTEVRRERRRVHTEGLADKRRLRRRVVSRRAAQLTRHAGPER